LAEAVEEDDRHEMKARGVAGDLSRNRNIFLEMALEGAPGTNRAPARAVRSAALTQPLASI